MRARHGLRGLLGGLRRMEPVPGEIPASAVDSELLLRVLCHEFRTPISTLTALTCALADEHRELTGDDQRAIIELARDQAVHLQSLLRGATAGTGALTVAGSRSRPSRVAGDPARGRRA
ncbi:histidine kinase dimerization/phospho-acceptor domain-containing protein, partial [Micromonospora tarensis]|nr:hypothetical protein [Micromonospora tarensis]